MALRSRPFSTLRPAVTGVLALGAAVLAGCQAEPTRESSAAAIQINNEIIALRVAQEALIVDTHIDLPYRLHRTPEDVSQTTGGEFDWPRAVQGGLNAAFMSIYLPSHLDATASATLADKLIDDVETIARRAPEKFIVAHCVRDVVLAKRTQRVALPLGMENGEPLNGDLARLDHYAARGIRYITLTHSRWNHISDSSYDPERRWNGLSDFGKRLIPEMNRRGVMIDVSHLSDDAFWQVIERSATPVVATHSSLRHFTPGFERNMSDDMVKALAAQGGVIQINFGSSFLTARARAWSDKLAADSFAYAQANGLQPDDPRMAAFREQYRAAQPFPYAATRHVLDHIDRAVALAGIDAVGLGSDYDGVGDSLPIGLKDVSTFPALIAGLLQRGYDLEAISKILGGNILRVWRANESYAEAAGYPVRCAIN